MNKIKEGTNVIEKKKPGRPRKNPIKFPQPKYGIQKHPLDESNFMEFTYDNPEIFKAVWKFLGKMSVNIINICFTPTHIIIWCNDHNNNNNIQVNINCAKVNRYFCEYTHHIKISSRNLELIMLTIDKYRNNISFFIKKDEMNKNMIIILDHVMDIEDYHTVEFIGNYEQVQSTSMFDDNDYTISFTMQSTYFKKLIKDVRSFTERITIRQEGPDEPLIWDYITKDKNVKTSHYIKNKTIQLVSKLKDDDTFTASFIVDYVKHISNNILSDKIYIYADENKPLMFISNIDNNVMEVKVLTSIIDDRKKLI